MRWAVSVTSLNSWPSWVRIWNSYLLSCSLCHVSRPIFFSFFVIFVCPVFYYETIKREVNTRLKWVSVWWKTEISQIWDIYTPRIHCPGPKIENRLFFCFRHSGKRKIVSSATWFSFWYKEASNTKKESFFCAEPGKAKKKIIVFFFRGFCYPGHASGRPSTAITGIGFFGLLCWTKSRPP
jgi:hypothetical protein